MSSYCISIFIAIFYNCFYFIYFCIRGGGHWGGCPQFYFIYTNSTAYKLDFIMYIHCTLLSDLPYYGLRTFLGAKYISILLMDIKVIIIAFKTTVYLN